MKDDPRKHRLTRRNFMKWTVGSAFSTLLVRSPRLFGTDAAPQNSLFSVSEIPMNPFYDQRSPNSHAGNSRFPTKKLSVDLFRRANRGPMDATRMK